jgi:predicted transcriptional regulator
MDAMQQLAESGEVTAQFELGLMFAEKATQTGYEQAGRWWRAAAESGEGVRSPNQQGMIKISKNICILFVLCGLRTHQRTI